MTSRDNGDDNNTHDRQFNGESGGDQQQHDRARQVRTTISDDPSTDATILRQTRSANFSFCIEKAEESNAASSSVEPSEPSTGRLERKRQLEKRRRDDFKEAFDKLNSILLQHDDGFRTEAQQREERVLWRASNRSPKLPKETTDNALFNRVEMVNQAVTTIERVVGENADLRKLVATLQAGNGDTAAPASNLGALDPARAASLGAVRTALAAQDPLNSTRVLMGGAAGAGAHLLTAAAQQQPFLHPENPFWMSQQHAAAAALTGAPFANLSGVPNFHPQLQPQQQLLILQSPFPLQGAMNPAVGRQVVFVGDQANSIACQHQQRPVVPVSGGASIEEVASLRGDDQPPGKRQKH